jgi:hypothetical protein
MSYTWQNPDDYQNRTAGLAKFNGAQTPVPVSHFDDQSPLQKFLSIFSDAQAPGHIAQNNMLAAASPQPAPQATPQPPAPPEINPLAKFASAVFIPGLRGHLDHQQELAQKEYEVQARRIMPHSASARQGDGISRRQR